MANLGRDFPRRPLDQRTRLLLVRLGIRLGEAALVRKRFRNPVRVLANKAVDFALRKPQRRPDDHPSLARDLHAQRFPPRPHKLIPRHACSFASRRRL